MHQSGTIQWHAQVMNKVEVYLENHYPEPFGIQQLSEQVHLSYHHLGEIFQHRRRESLGGYLVRKKLERAATLYSYTSLNLAEVADQTGYATKHSLSKAFAKYFGVSPGNFVKRSLYQPQSPNVFFDEIFSVKQYEALLRVDLPYPYTIATLEHCWLTGRLYAGFDPAADRVVAAGSVRDGLTGGHYFLKAFDSVNFSPVDCFRMFGGRFHRDIVSPAAVAHLKQECHDQLVLPVKDGRYVMFDVPPGTVLNRQRYITLCREHLVRQMGLFRLRDFYDFFLFSSEGGGQAGHYYMWLGGNGHA